MSPGATKFACFTLVCMHSLSYNIIKDHEELGFTSKNITPKPASQCLHGILADIIIKPKSVFTAAKTASNK